ncbi:MAG: dodecin domain-containing protein [Deltaproteobacteria bacterium]|nr:dodecin domain-containing protein [Deltaproteobacteria bacterium]
MGTYKFIEIVGTSSKSWEDAASVAVEDACKELGEVRVAEVKQMDLKVVGDVIFYRIRLSVSFKIQSMAKLAEVLGTEVSED